MLPSTNLCYLMACWRGSHDTWKKWTIHQSPCYKKDDEIICWVFGASRVNFSHSPHFIKIQSYFLAKYWLQKNTRPCPFPNTKVHYDFDLHQQTMNTKLGTSSSSLRRAGFLAPFCLQPHPSLRKISPVSVESYSSSHLQWISSHLHWSTCHSSSAVATKSLKS